MKIQSQITLHGLWLFLTGFACQNATAQLPADFPYNQVTTYDSNRVAPGYIFLDTWSSTPNSPSYMMILNNDGTLVDGDKYVRLDHTGINFKMQPNGLLSYDASIASLPFAGGWDVEDRIVDDSVTNIVETVQMGNGYVAESHDFQLLPNGNKLLFGYYLSPVDLSKIVSGGNPAALVSGGIIQELDPQGNPVFQWRAWDHYNFEDFTYPNPTAAVISEFHFNDIFLDVDGNIIVTTPTEVRKINRQTGDVVWTLGGSQNEFTIVGTGFDASDFGGHGTYRLANGHLIEYDNSHAGITSRAIEYTLDESNKVATVVWSYTPPTMIGGFATGDAQRLPNGNTLICWGLPRTGGVPTCTEVTPAGDKVFELSITNLSILSYRVFRFPYPAAAQEIQDSQTELSAGNSYFFTNTDVEVDVTAGAGGYNRLTVTRAPYAPLQCSFVTLKPPRLLPVRIQMDTVNISSITADVLFDGASLGFDHPEQLAVYQRLTAGSGPFVALPTSYNPATHQLGVTVSQFGEFAFGYPDVAEVAYPPILDRPDSYLGAQTNVIAPRKAEPDTVYSVNQERPILLAWSPQGFGRFYDLQVATDPGFATLGVDASYQQAAFYVWSNALPNTTYYWRVRTMVEGDAGLLTGDWATNSFQTVPPMLQVTAPNGGEAWQRGLRYYIQWNANLAENVVIDLYKSGTFVESIVTNADTGAYRWQVDQTLVPGNDYSLRITSAANPALFDSSDAPFNIDVPSITSLQPNPGGAWVLNWAGTTASVYVEFKPSLDAGSWQTVAGPLTGSGWTNTSPAGLSGFYRLRLQ
jgi:Arylsulfotransferase (ASST)/Kre9/KNH-like N-terminal Ig-like domain